ncbi:hypothetical protein CJA_3748 [Cellvibrio japonicus Ueda107]|uniref:Uncharacterized protein n=1 Tax=Cellvibrio japonicus (strain Ueda107) TaxID=498211 RepID=B3PI05_CELJU|nr:hypothetical protein CJA_3748 [Cellvibrio japonicus Ueda107]
MQNWSVNSVYSHLGQNIPAQKICKKMYLDSLNARMHVVHKKPYKKHVFIHTKNKTYYFFVIKLSKII